MTRPDHIALGRSRSSITKLRCTSCGGPIFVPRDSSRETVNCAHCGALHTTHQRGGSVGVRLSKEVTVADVLDSLSEEAVVAAVEAISAASRGHDGSYKPTLAIALMVSAIGLVADETSTPGETLLVCAHKIIADSLMDMQLRRVYAGSKPTWVERATPILDPPTITDKP